MIDVASLACRSCITVYARRRLCAGCSLPKSTTARSQHSRLGRIVRLYGQQPAAKTRHNTGPHSTVACSMSPSQRLLSISYRFVWLALLMAASRSSLNTGHSHERQNVAQTDTLNKGITESCHYPLWPYVPRLDSWVENGAAFCSKSLHRKHSAYSESVSWSAQFYTNSSERGSQNSPNRSRVFLLTNRQTNATKP